MKKIPSWAATVICAACACVCMVQGRYENAAICAAFAAMNMFIALA